MMDQATSDYELLTEHLSYPPVSLLDDIINTVNVLADRALDNVERLLLSLPPSKVGFKQSKKDSDKANNSLPPEEAAKLEIENGTHQLETLLNSAIDKNFDKFELYIMQNILTVEAKDRPFMQLSHYEGLDLSTNNPDKPTLESVTALRRKVQASQKLHVALEAEKARNDALLRKLKAALGVVDGSNNGIKQERKEDGAEEDEKPVNSLGFLREKGNLEQGGTDKPITTTTEFTLSQLQALRSLSTTLRDILPKLGVDETVAPDNADDASSSFSGDQKTWRSERAEYIENASRRYLERSGGLELGQQGEVRDGEWQGGGPALAKGEVEGLENVVSMLSASNAATGASAAQAAHDEGDDDVMDES